MAEIKFPIQVDLPDDWIEQIVDRLRNDPEAEWVEVVRCKDCINHDKEICYFWSRFYGTINTPDDGFCYKAERRTDGN